MFSALSIKFVGKIFVRSKLRLSCPLTSPIRSLKLLPFKFSDWTGIHGPAVRRAGAEQSPTYTESSSSPTSFEFYQLYVEFEKLQSGSWYRRKCVRLPEDSKRIYKQSDAYQPWVTSLPFAFAFDLRKTFCFIFSANQFNWFATL